jgi:methionyl-tRNA formyltransferase
MKASPSIGVCAAFVRGYDVLSFILNFGNKIEFVATCAKDDTEYEEKIYQLCQEKNIPVKRKVNANSEEFISFLRSNEIDIVILAWWPAIIKKAAIEAVRIGWINLHPSLLPYNRGKHGYYWSVVEGTPFGVSVHFIDEGIDSGKIIFQRPIEIDITDTGEKLYSKSANEVVSLFKENYHKIVALDFEATAQDEKIATTHFGKEINPHSEINLDSEYKAIDLINIIRGRTFHGGDSAFFYLNDKKYHIRLEIEEAE